MEGYIRSFSLTTRIWREIKKFLKKIDVKSARPHHFFRRRATLNEQLNSTGLINNSKNDVLHLTTHPRTFITREMISSLRIINSSNSSILDIDSKQKLTSLGLPLNPVAVRSRHRHSSRGRRCQGRVTLT